jgi:DNA polymerase
LKEAVINAINRPGETFTARRLRIQRVGAWLKIQLPSGRFLCYPSPQVDEKGQISYMGVNQYSRQWSRIKTYGGKLFENITQAAARDVLAHNMPLVERHGYEIVLSVHDELITEAPDTSDYSVGVLCELMAMAPDWAEGLPLASAGFEGPRYKKD